MPFLTELVVIAHTRFLLTWGPPSSLPPSLTTPPLLDELADGLSSGVLAVQSMVEGIVKIVLQSHNVWEILGCTKYGLLMCLKWEIRQIDGWIDGLTEADRHTNQCTHFLHKLLEDGVLAPLLLEGLAEVEEGDAWPVAPEVGLQTAWHHWNTLIHQIEQRTMV